MDNRPGQGLKVKVKVKEASLGGLHLVGRMVLGLLSDVDCHETLHNKVSVTG